MYVFPMNDSQRVHRVVVVVFFWLLDGPFVIIQGGGGV